VASNNDSSSTVAFRLRGGDEGLDSVASNNDSVQHRRISPSWQRRGAGANNDSSSTVAFRLGGGDE
jgi:hypothetical protein